MTLTNGQYGTSRVPSPLGHYHIRCEKFMFKESYATCMHGMVQKTRERQKTARKHLPNASNGFWDRKGRRGDDGAGWFVGEEF